MLSTIGALDNLNQATLLYLNAPALDKSQVQPIPASFRRKRSPNIVSRTRTQGTSGYFVRLKPWCRRRKDERCLSDHDSHLGFCSLHLTQGPVTARRVPTGSGAVQIT